MIILKTVIRFTLILSSILLSGCAALSQTFWQRPVIEDVPGGFNTLALTADRRIAVFKSDKSDKDNYKGEKACAEAQPDVALSSEVESKLTAAIKDATLDGSAELSESVKQAITLAYQRTENSDLVRQLGWQICQGYLNGAITESDYLRLLETMVIAALVDTELKDKASIQQFKELLPSAR